jgi:hypothetical protein
MWWMRFIDGSVPANGPPILSLYFFQSAHSQGKIERVSNLATPKEFQNFVKSVQKFGQNSSIRLKPIDLTRVFM